MSSRGASTGVFSAIDHHLLNGYVGNLGNGGLRSLLLQSVADGRQGILGNFDLRKEIEDVDKFRIYEDGMVTPTSCARRNYPPDREDDYGTGMP